MTSPPRHLSVHLLPLFGGLLMSTAALALTAEVKNHLGSPTIFVNGKPISPLTFFGWAAGGQPTVVTIDTQWKQYHVTFTAPEDSQGHGGIHFRMGGEGPGTVWVDNVQFYPGPKADQPAENWVRQGDWEGTKQQITRDWSFFQAEYAHAQADWDLDTTTQVTGRQSLRVDIRHGGEPGNRMHLHWYQSGYSLKRGQQYTYSLWMKADKPRVVDFMALHIGEPWTIYSGDSSVYQNQVKLAHEAGIDIVSCGIPMPWPRPGEAPNFAGVDFMLDVTLASNPQALLLPRFGVTPPGWWLEAHPDDMMVFDDGPRQFFCMASEAWRTEMLQHLRALVRHCEDKYGDHMLGYHPCGQHTGEWFYERSWEPRLSDFSPAMSRGFARWAQQKYGSLAALRAAWGDPTITLETVRVPTKEEQLHTTLGFFRDPGAERKVIDYFEYKQLAMEEPLEMMARVIKEETQRTKLVCFFYGYTFDMHGIPMGPQTSGHLAMAKLCACPDVDILCSPISYLDREVGGAGCFMSAVDSVRGSGKLWLNEDDTRTYLTKPEDDFGRAETRQGTYWVHQRNFAQIWPRRLACWYMDLGGVGWLNTQDIWDNIAPLQRFYQQHLDEPARWAPEVALIVDEASPWYTRCSRDLHSPLVYEMRSQFFRTGAPFGIYLLCDLVAGRVPPAKAYFFANCFRLDTQQREALKRATDGKTAVWFYGGGFLNEDAADANMSEALGIAVARGTPQRGRVRPERGDGLTSGLDSEFGVTTVLDPLWTVSDAQAEPVARYADGSTAAAAKQMAQGLRVYIGTLHCPARLLRNILRASGVHLYCDGDDVILTDGHFLAITATSAGAKRLLFPGKRDVFDALSGEQIARAVDHLELDMELGEVRNFLLREEA